MGSQMVLPVRCLHALLFCPVFTALKHLDSLFLSFSVVLMPLVMSSLQHDLQLAAHHDQHSHSTPSGRAVGPCLATHHYQLPSSSSFVGNPIPPCVADALA